MSSTKKKDAEYKKCVCGKAWKTRDSFLKDKKVKIVGYQPDFINRRYNHFLFQHKIKDCGEFIGIRASDFSDLREKGCPKDVCMGQEGCPGYCLDTFDLRVCSVTCRNATDREVAARIRNRRTLRSGGSGPETKKRPKKQKQMAGAG